jgi:hypothetical protein
MLGLRTIPQGERLMVMHTDGRVTYVDGPRRIAVLTAKTMPLRRVAAEPHQFLVIRKKDGTTEHVPGPAAVWFDPIVHLEIKVEAATKIDANEALVVFQKDEQSVTRRIVRGPALFVPTPQEWLHPFSWHGTDPKHGYRKVPHALNFTKLLVIPDQMYFDVESVRTADDALLVVKLMVFFELCDIEKMLDQTHDPIADFINAMSADVVDFVSGNDFDAFKSKTDALNQLGTYPQLTQRAEKIGYRINKVVYRGYYASDKLQAMHDNAIECRTRLRLEAETERQAQELADLKLTRELERAGKRQEMEEAETNHQNRLKQLEHEAELNQREGDQKQFAEAKWRDAGIDAEVKRRQNELALEHERALHEEQTGFFTRMRELQVDLTRYLVAQYQNPDKVIRIDGGTNGTTPPQLHLHEN